MRIKKIVSYLSGPISDNMDGYKAEFAEAQRIAESRGRIVLSPATLPLGLTELDYMGIGLRMLEAADEIILLRGWERSDGAKFEAAYAERIGKRCVRLEQVEKERARFSIEGSDRNAGK